MPGKRNSRPCHSLSSQSKAEREQEESPPPGPGALPLPPQAATCSNEALTSRILLSPDFHPCGQPADPPSPCSGPGMLLALLPPLLEAPALCWVWEDLSMCALNPRENRMLNEIKRLSDTE